MTFQLCTGLCIENVTLSMLQRSDKYNIFRAHGCTVIHVNTHAVCVLFNYNGPGNMHKVCLIISHSQYNNTTQNNSTELKSHTVVSWKVEVLAVTHATVKELQRLQKYTEKTVSSTVGLIFCSERELY